MTWNTVTCKAFTKEVNTSTRTVEQIVSVFGNVDLGKDRVNAGAFAKTLEEWNGTEDVLPAYFSHQWEDPFANIGAVIAAEELLPGDERLPDKQVPFGDGTTKSLRELGGLLVTYKFDDPGVNPFGDQVFHLLKERRITQASFAYDIVEQKRNSDGTNDLLELKLIEVGPTLLGMNPATTLAASRKSIAELAKASGLSEEDVEKVMAAATKDSNHTFIPSADDATKCQLCGKGQTAVAHIQRLSDNTDHGLKSVTWAGSIEERQGQISELATAWAMDNDIGDGGFYAVHLEATFTDKTIFMVEGWNDPWGEGQHFEASVIENEDGTISIGEPVEVVVEQSTRPKAFLSRVAKAQKAKDATKRKDAATLPPDEEETTDGTNPEAGDGNGEGEDSEVKSKSAPDVSEATRLREEAELLLMTSL